MLKHTVCYDSHACALYGLRFRSFAHKDSLFTLLFYFPFIYVLFVLHATAPLFVIINKLWCEAQQTPPPAATYRLILTC